MSVTIPCRRLRRGGFDQRLAWLTRGVLRNPPHRVAEVDVSGHRFGFDNLKRRISARNLWLAAAAVLIVLWSWSAWEMHRPGHVVVTTAPVTLGTISRRVVATGTLEAVTTVQVGAQVSGTIQSLSADYNSVVRAGDVVAKLDPALLDAALREAQAALAEARASLSKAEADQTGSVTALEDAKTKLSRARELAAQQLIPQSDLDAAQIVADQAVADLGAAKSQVNEARAVVDQASAAVNQATVNLAHTVITSPIDGIVVARNVDVGQTVAAAIQAPVLFSIASDLKQMRVEVDVDESDIGGITEGELATFEVKSYPDETFVGGVSQIRLQPIAEQTASATTIGAPSSQSTDVPTVIAYAAIIDVSNPDERLRPGMTATVTLNGSHRDPVTRIPNNALSFRPPVDVLSLTRQGTGVIAQSTPSPYRGTVWKYNGATFSPTEVRLGLADGDWTELTGGAIHADDTLVTAARVTR